LAPSPVGQINRPIANALARSRWPLRARMPARQREAIRTLIESLAVKQRA
jgi:hypothetical protein